MEILTPQEVIHVRWNDPYKIVKLADGAEVTCHALIVATGVNYRCLNVPGAEALTGKGTRISSPSHFFFLATLPIFSVLLLVSRIFCSFRHTSLPC